MSALTKIEWTDRSWNPVRGCALVSEGCRSCYAMKVAHRFSGPGKPYEGLTEVGPKGPRWNGTIRVIPDALSEPLRWRKPQRIFVNSMSDLFHEDVPDEFIDRVFDVMWECPQHTFQILTKRVGRMVKYVSDRASRRRFGWVDWQRPAMQRGEFISLDDIRMRNMCGYVGDADWSCDHPTHGGAENSCDASDCPIAQRVDEREKLEEIGVADEYTYGSDGYAESNGFDWLELQKRPLQAACGNVWLGFSAENQRMFDERMRQFRALRWILGPHFVLFASLEPLLGPIDFNIKYWPGEDDPDQIWNALSRYDFSFASEAHSKPHLDWVIAGGESGSGARPFEVAWAHSIVKQCRDAGVPVFVKQLGSKPVVPAGRLRHWEWGGEIGRTARFSPTDPAHESSAPWRVVLDDRKGGDPQEWPEPLRVRQFPEVAR
jgi:protein gp37